MRRETLRLETGDVVTRVDERRKVDSRRLRLVIFRSHTLVSGKKTEGGTFQSV